MKGRTALCASLAVFAAASASAQLLLTDEPREFTDTVATSEYLEWVFQGVPERRNGAIWAPRDLTERSDFLTFVEYEDRTVMAVLSSDIERWRYMGSFAFVVVRGPALVYVSRPDDGRQRASVYRITRPEAIRRFLDDPATVIIEHGVTVTFARDTGGHGSIAGIQHYRVSGAGPQQLLAAWLDSDRFDRSDAFEHAERRNDSNLEQRFLTDMVLESPYFDDVFGRLEDQHPELVWMPSNRLNEATLLTIIEYEDTSLFVCFSQGTYRHDAGLETERIEVFGPAVIYPVLKGDGEAKFGNSRYVGVTKEADWSKRDRHFFDEFVSAVFADGTGGHGQVMLVTQYRIRNEEERRKLARLMGKYFPVSPERDP